MSPALRNIVVVGGSYVGLGTARELMKIVPASHRVLLVEPHSHFNHIFTFPRFAILSHHEHKAFIPYTGIFTPSIRHSHITARATGVFKDHITLDRPWEGSENVPYDYLVIATGTTLSPPSMMPFDSKQPSVRYIQDHQSQVRQAENVTIVGGGAVGVQMALDMRELYPEKGVTLVHSRARVMQMYHEGLHEIISEAFEEKGIRLVTGTRAVVPEGGFPKTASAEGFTLRLNNGEEIRTNLVILATGQKPNTQLLNTLPTTSSSGLINPSKGFIRVKKTLQVDDQAYPNIFAVGDIADSGAHKAARPGSVQAGVVARNILRGIEGSKEIGEEYQPGPAGIHLSLGLKRNVVFRNPNVAEGQTEPTVIEKFDGQDDLGVGGVWGRMNVSLEDERVQAAI